MENKENWEEEFESIWKYFGVEKEKNIKEMTENLIHSLLQSAREEVAHKTEDGYCCACDYDIAGLEERIEEARQEEREKIRQAVENMTTGDEPQNILYISSEKWVKWKYILQALSSLQENK